MSLKRLIAGKWAVLREKEIRKAWEHPRESQEKTLKKLLKIAEKTQFGKAHHFKEIKNSDTFRKNVSVRNYEESLSWLSRVHEGEPNVCWPGIPEYLAKTSGTTGGAKYIPLTKDSMRFQVKGARDTLLTYIQRTGHSDFLDGKLLFLSGSPELEKNPVGILTGRLSGIVNHFVPSYLKGNQVPSYKVNSIENWEEKVSAIIDECVSQDLRMIGGIPPWVQMFFERAEEKTGKKILSIWPNLSVYVQGGVDYAPYKSLLDPYFQNKVELIEVFPASEGFYAFQDSAGEGLLMNLNYGMFYEFIPVEQFENKNPQRLGIEELKTGKQYVLIVSTNAGLWAYNTGDTVRVVSQNPLRVKVSGRIKQFISAFGEHVIAEEVNKAMEEACEATNTSIAEFTVAPLIESEGGKSAHEWWVEFAKEPQNESEFMKNIDHSLRRSNPYYDDLRKGNILQLPGLRKVITSGTAEYMKSLGKLGGQNKFPRLTNNRDVVQQLVKWEKSK